MGLSSFVPERRNKFCAVIFSEHLCFLFGKAKDSLVPLNVSISFH